MKLKINKQALNYAVQQVSKAVSGRTAIPILSGIKIVAQYDGMTLTASDTDISIESFIPSELNDEQLITLQEPGSIVLPAKLFSEIIRKLPTDEVEIESDESFLTVIRSGSAELQMAGLDPEEFPLLPSLDENLMFQIDSSKLKTLIKQTIFAVSANESTPILTGVLWTLDQGELKLVSTDRHRLATSKSVLPNAQGQQISNVVISGKNLNELLKLLPDEEVTIEIVVADNQVLFKLPDILFYSRILDGMYPDTTKIIPQTYKTELVIHTKTLYDAIDRAYLLSREEKTNIVKLVASEDGTIEVSSSLSELGKMREEIMADSMNGEPVKISFNSKYMLDALKVIDDEKLFIGFTGAMSPIVLHPSESNDLLQLILPYRTIS